MITGKRNLPQRFRSGHTATRTSRFEWFAPESGSDFDFGIRGLCCGQVGPAVVGCFLDKPGRVPLMEPTPVGGAKPAGFPSFRAFEK